MKKQDNIIGNFKPIKNYSDKKSIKGKVKKERPEEIVTKSGVYVKTKWDLDKIYSNEADLFADLKKAVEISAEVKKRFKGKLTNDLDKIKEYYMLMEKFRKYSSKPDVYLGLKEDLNLNDSKIQELSYACSLEYEKISENLSFVDNEIINTDEEILRKFAKDDYLKQLEGFIEDIILDKAHQLTDDQIDLLEVMSRSYSSSKIYDDITELEMDYGEILNKNGKKVKLTKNNYYEIMLGEDRVLRKNAYNRRNERYKLHNQSLSTIYLNKVIDVTEMIKFRKYNSVFEYTEGRESSEKVYSTLIKVVGENLSLVKKYGKYWRKSSPIPEKDFAGYDGIYNHFRNKREKLPFEDAVEIVLDVLKVYGDEYVEKVKEGLKDGCIDVYPNPNKVTGGYNLSNYFLNPYILLNYTDTFEDIYTLIHEIGHFMHGIYLKTQPIFASGSTTMVAEVASTVNEILLSEYLLKKETDLRKRAYILSIVIDQIIGSLITQSKFAEFERTVFDKCWNKEVLSKDVLNNIYLDLEKKYSMKKKFKNEDKIKNDWSKIPHFYRPFYVYKYATGISSAIYIATNILKGKPGYLEKYKSMLKAGYTMTSLETLKLAEVDLEAEETYKNAFRYLKKKIDEFKEVTEALEKKKVKKEQKNTKSKRIKNI